MTLGWAIITTGLHTDVKIAPALNATPDTELVAVYSRDQGRAEAFAQQHGARAAYSDDVLWPSSARFAQ
jgi:predicted dehydrogenase